MVIYSPLQIHIYIYETVTHSTRISWYNMHYDQVAFKYIEYLQYMLFLVLSNSKLKWL